MGALFPVDAVGGVPNYTGQLARQALSVLMGGRKSVRPLGARSGVAAGSPSGIVMATSVAWTVNPHAGVLDLQTAATAGGTLYAIDVAVAGSMTPADASNQRVDSLFIRHDDPSQSDGSSVPAPTITYVAGTPGAAGGARGAAGGPPVVPSRAFELAQITVPPVGGGSPSVAVVAQYVVASGGIVPCRSNTFGDYPSSPYVGQYIDDATLGLCRWDGSQWSPVSQTGQRLAAAASTGNSIMTLLNTWYPIPGTATGMTINLATQRWIRVVGRATRITMVGGANGLYNVGVGFNAGGYNPASATYTGGSQTLLTATGGPGAQTEVEDVCLQLAAGQWTFHVAVQRKSGGSSSDAAGGDVTVYDAGPA